MKRTGTRRDSEDTLCSDHVYRGKERNMGECPNEDCKKNLDKIHDTMFKDKVGGVRFDIAQLKLVMKDLCNKVVPRKTMFKVAGTVLLVIGVPAYIAFINVWAEDKIAPEKYATKSDIRDQNHRVLKLEEQFKHVKDNIIEIKEQQKLNTKEILDTIKKISR